MSYYMRLQVRAYMSYITEITGGAVIPVQLGEI